MRVLDLFAGIGGFSLSAHWMGWQTVAFVEKEPFCQKVLRKNFGLDIEIHDDIFTFSGKPFRGRVNIVTGGFPCQPFSAAGKRKGRTDERHLFPQMLRVIREVKPRWVVAENVRGLLSIESGSVFAEVVSSLEGEGYEVVTFCVPASAVEAPHRRDRLWIIAHSNGLREHSGHREIQGTDGEVLEWDDDAESSYSDKSTTFNTGCKSAEVREPRTMERQNGQAESTGRTGILDTAAHSDCDAPDADNQRHLRRQEQGQDSGRAVSAGCWDDRSLSESSVGNSESANAPDLFSDGGYDHLRVSEQRQPISEPRNGGGQTFIKPWSENWLEAATRLCSMANGLSGELVRPRGWRVNALKAAGNSIVPQIAFEIFKAIEAAEKDE